MPPFFDSFSRRSSNSRLLAACLFAKFTSLSACEISAFLISSCRSVSRVGFRQALLMRAQIFA